MRELEVKLAKTDGWLTRNEASDTLRCSLQTLKNYEDRGLLHPRHGLRKDRCGSERVMLVYNPKELAELPLRNGGGQPRLSIREPGEQAARAFELLRQGWALDEIVIELRETPDRIDYLNERWLEQTQARYVITPEAQKAFEQIVGAFKDVTDLVEILTRNKPPPYVITSKAKQALEQIVEAPFKDVTELIELLRKKACAGNVITPEAKDALEHVIGTFSDVTELVGRITKKYSAEL